MAIYATSKIITNRSYFFDNLKLSKHDTKYKSGDFIIGWGKKHSGLKAETIAKKNNIQKILCEDGLYRSIDIPAKTPNSFSIVKDKIGIYYDANEPSELENILNDEDNFINFDKDEIKKNIEYIKHYKLSKFNTHEKIDSLEIDKNKKNLIFIAQTKDDSSIVFGKTEGINDIDIILDIIKNYPDYNYFIKIHPEVINKNKKSDIDLSLFESYNFTVIEKNYNPIELLEFFSIVYTKTSQMGFEALLLNKKVICFGAPFYSGWGLTEDRVLVGRRIRTRTLEEIVYAFNVLYTDFVNPSNKHRINFSEALELLNYYKNIYSMDKGQGYFFGFSSWKQKYVLDFVRNKNTYFLPRAFLRFFQDKNTYIWGNKYYKYQNVIRVEDGFIRSKSLGSDLSRPLSLVFDKQGIYFDATKPSDLEDILNTDCNFSKNLIQKSKKLIKLIKTNKISKYNNYPVENIEIKTNKKIILVVGQVEDDASIKYNLAPELTNLTLLETVRKENPNAFIIFKPHPDLLSNNRKNGYLNVEDILKNGLCDKIVFKTHIDSVLNIVEEVHVITSTVGIEALLRNKKVICHGTPFYSGWGLTEDKFFIDRRKKKRTLEELIGAVYILYPRYINPLNKQFTDVFEIIDLINNDKGNNKNIYSFFKSFLKWKK